MTTRYKLPEWCGGAEVTAPDSLAVMQIGEEPGLLVTIADTTHRMVVPRSWLTEVKPPLPPVPDVLAVAIGDHVFCCDDDRDGPVFACPGAPVCHKRGYDWAELNELAREEGKPIIPLVPDPADDAPELPWTLGDHKDRVAVTDNGLVWIFLEPDYHSPEEARLRAAAILRAAREAEQR